MKPSTNFLITSSVCFIIGVFIGMEYSFIIPSLGFTQGYFIGVFLGALIMGVSILTSQRFKWVQP
jgi:hypothetical protein